MSTSMTWSGVFCAITTPLTDDDRIDTQLLGEHATWLVEHGVRGIVTCGSLGEGATLSMDERKHVFETCLQAVGDRVPVVASVSARATKDAVALAQHVSDAGGSGLMVLPPYVHRGPWFEMRDHVRAIIDATPLSCMLYSNLPAYGVDFTVARIAELAELCPNLHAVKDSGGDVRRLTELRCTLGDRVAALAGLDDMALEAGLVGVQGWIAGLVNAFPAQSVALFDLAREGRRQAALELYRWFLPLLQLDTVPEFVQLIKLVQSRVGWGSERVRLPRQGVRGELRRRTLELVERALAERPEPLASTGDAR